MSGHLPWFRLYAEMVDDEKIRLLAFEDRWHYVALLCCKGQGLLDAGDSRELLERKLAVKLEVSVDEIKAIIRRLAAAGLLDPETLEPQVGLAKPARPSPSIWAAIRDRIFQRDSYTCRYCGARGGRLECDHVVPVSRGGSHDDSNLVTACESCNRSKRDRLPSEWRVLA